MPKYLVTATGCIKKSSPQLREYLVDAIDKDEAQEIVTEILRLVDNMDDINIKSIRAEMKS